MAGDWTKMRDDLSDDPAVLSMATDLGVDVDLIVGKLHRLWSWAGRHTITGRIVGANSSLIDRIARQESFAEAMTKVKWLLLDEGGATFPKWHRHNSKAAKRRALDQRRKATRRAEEKRKVSAEQADKNGTRGEERRGEEKREIPGGDGFCFSLPERFNTPGLRSAVMAWSRYLPWIKPGHHFDQLQLTNLVMHHSRLGWDAEKLERAITFSIAKSFRSICDPDQDRGAKKPTESRYKPLPPREAST